MKNLFVRFLVVFGLFSSSSVLGTEEDDFEYDFQVLTIDTIEQSDLYDEEGLQNYSGHILMSLTPKTKEKLCIAAKRHADLDGFDSDTEEIYHLAHYSINVETDTTEAVGDVLLRCETIPRSYLRVWTLVGYSSASSMSRERKRRSGEEKSSSSMSLPPRRSGESTTTRRTMYDDSANGDGDGEEETSMAESEPIVDANVDGRPTTTSPMKIMITEGSRTDRREQMANEAKPVHEITILLRKNRFMYEPYVLNVFPIVAPPEKVDPETVPAVVEQTTRYTLYEHDRLDVCVAAKKHMIDAVVRLKRARIQVPTTFEFLSTVRGKETQMAMDCESVPPMYVHFKEVIMTKSGITKPMDVMWVKPRTVPAAAAAPTPPVNDTIAESITDANGIATQSPAVVPSARSSDPTLVTEQRRGPLVDRTTTSMSESTDSKSAPMEE